MLDDLIHNPQVIIYIVLGLFFLVSKGMRNKMLKVQKESGRTDQRYHTNTKERSAATPDRQAELRARREEQMRIRLETARRQLGDTSTPAARSAESALLRVMEQADRQFFNVDTASEPAPQAARPAEPAPAKNSDSDSSADPFAFQSLLHRDDARQRVDYDQVATDYDKRARAFEFRAPTQESESQEYHLQSFGGFQAARGISGRDRAISAKQGVYGLDAEAVPGVDLFSTPEDLRRAIIAHEIFSRRGGLRR